jgi:hypothetical protein
VQRKSDGYLMEFVINSTTIGFDFDEYEIMWIKNYHHLAPVSDLAKAYGTMVDKHILHGKQDVSSSKFLLVYTRNN